LTWSSFHVALREFPTGRNGGVAIRGQHADSPWTERNGRGKKTGVEYVFQSGKPLNQNGKKKNRGGFVLHMRPQTQAGKKGVGEDTGLS